MKRKHRFGKKCRWEDTPYKKRKDRLQKAGQGIIQFFRAVFRHIKEMVKDLLEDPVLRLQVFDAIAAEDFNPTKVAYG